MKYDVTMKLKCRQCKKTFDEKALPVMLVSEAMANLNFSYHHVCEDSTKGLTIGKADVLGMKVDFE
jgi:hypothetical protein